MSSKRKLVKIFVEHTYYGCDTGCCGHVVNLEFDNGDFVEEAGRFRFSHPWEKENVVQWAKDLILENVDELHIRDLNWENIMILDDVCVDC